MVQGHCNEAQNSVVQKTPQINQISSYFWWECSLILQHSINNGRSYSYVILLSVFFN